MGPYSSSFELSMEHLPFLNSILVKFNSAILLFNRYVKLYIIITTEQILGKKLGLASSIHDFFRRH